MKNQLIHHKARHPTETHGVIYQELGKHDQNNYLATLLINSSMHISPSKISITPGMYIVPVNGTHNSIISIDQTPRNYFITRKQEGAPSTSAPWLVPTLRWLPHF